VLGDDHGGSSAGGRAAPIVPSTPGDSEAM